MEMITVDKMLDDRYMRFLINCLLLCIKNFIIKGFYCFAYLFVRMIQVYSGQPASILSIGNRSVLRYTEKIQFMKLLKSYSNLI